MINQFKEELVGELALLGANRIGAENEFIRTKELLDLRQQTLTKIDERIKEVQDGITRFEAFEKWEKDQTKTTSTKPKKTTREEGIEGGSDTAIKEDK